MDVDFLENEPHGQRQHLAVLLQKRGSTGLDLIRQVGSVANVTIVAAKMLKMEINYYLCFINEPMPTKNLMTYWELRSSFEVEMSKGLSVLVTV